MSNQISSGFPFRKPTELKNPIYLFFMTPELQAGVCDLGLDPYEPGSYDVLRSYSSPSDIAFNIILDKLLREHVLFSDSDNSFTTLDILLSAKTSNYQTERNNLLNPLKASSELQKEVIQYLNYDSDSKSEKESGVGKVYDLRTYGHILTIGVKHGFLNNFISQKDVCDFYRNCLELCQATIPGPNLRDTALFAKFVKLSISF